MAPLDDTVIDRIRESSRAMVRELGFMEATLAGTRLSPSAVHAVIEIGLGRAHSARELAGLLRLEKSTVSRLVRALVAEGYLAERRDGPDGRVKALALTDIGAETFAAISDFARDQVRRALAPLAKGEAAALAEALELYADALAGAARQDDAAGKGSGGGAVTLVPGYWPGLIGRAVEMHALYYARTVGFGAAFETKVAGEMAQFVPRLERACNGVWTAMRHGRAVGTVAIDGEDLGGDAAHLRWFIVADGQRGAGIGRALLSQAVDFVDRHGFAETRLWTFSGLDAARRLYERAGFVLVEEKPGTQWGRRMREQQFRRPRPAPVAPAGDGPAG